MMVVNVRVVQKNGTRLSPVHCWKWALWAKEVWLYVCP